MNRERGKSELCLSMKIAKKLSDFRVVDNDESLSISYTDAYVSDKKTYSSLILILCVLCFVIVPVGMLVTQFSAMIRDLGVMGVLRFLALVVAFIVMVLMVRSAIVDDTPKYNSILECDKSTGQIIASQSFVNHISQIKALQLNQYWSDFEELYSIQFVVIDQEKPQCVGLSGLDKSAATVLSAKIRSACHLEEPPIQE